MSGVEIASYMMAVVYVVSFLALSAILAKEAGRPIWLFGRDAEPQALPALLFKIGFAGAVVWPPVQAVLGWAGDPIGHALDGDWLDVLGHLLVVLGACLAILAQRQMGASWRIGAALGEAGPIVDGGLFAVSRNPVFVGQMMLFLGLFLSLPSLVQLGLTAGVFVAAGLQVRIEERVLEASLGEPYRAYRRRVRRWFGRRRQGAGA